MGGLVYHFNGPAQNLMVKKDSRNQGFKHLNDIVGVDLCVYPLDQSDEYYHLKGRHPS